MVVRLARQQDLPQILEIMNWAIRQTIANFHLEPRTVEELSAAWREGHKEYPWFVAESDGHVLGYAMASAFKTRCAYQSTVEVSVYVHPDHFGQGIGKALYAELIPALRARGYHSAIAVIALPNPASEQLHAAYGFRHVGTFSEVGRKFGRWHDVAYWQLML